MSEIDLTPDWMDWKESARRWCWNRRWTMRGADLPLAPSQRGLTEVRVRQLRDPGIFEENGETYLLYSVAGEAGIAIARLHGL